MKKIVAGIFLSLSFFSAQAQYAVRVTQLNTKKEFLLKPGESYYFQFTGKAELYHKKLSAVEKESLVFEDVQASPSTLSFVSKHRYRNNFFSKIRRNANRNLGILPAPTFDFETTHLLEIIPEASKAP